MTRAAPWLLLAAAAAALLPVQDRVDRLSAGREEKQVLYLWSGRQVRLLAPGFRNLLADIYWLRTVQYFGAERLFSTGKRFDLLYPLIDITTDLDPRMEIAYRYGSIFLFEPWPTGKGDAQLGVAVLEKGIRNMPRSWRLRQDLGYYRYLFMGDAPGGARILMEAGRVPGAPYWLETLAGSILTKGGHRQTARAVWSRLHEQAEGGLVKENARLHLQRLDGLAALADLEAAAARFRAATHRDPRSPEDLLAVGLPLSGLRDPTGTPFEYRPGLKRFWFGRGSRLWHQPNEHALAGVAEGSAAAPAGAPQGQQPQGPAGHRP